jgi:hypothetical protein
VGWDWDYPGSFTLVNFDEGGSCRSALGGFEYSPFIGGQTLSIAKWVGVPRPNPTIVSAEQRAREFCHGPGHIRVARVYSAVLGALTCVLIVAAGFLFRPERPQIGWTAGWLLAASGFHISESHSGTVDAPSVFFIYLFTLLLLVAVTRRSGLAWLASPLLLIPAVWTKYWVFAAFGFAAALPMRLWRYLGAGVPTRRLMALLAATLALIALATNPLFHQKPLWPLLALYYLFVPWRRMRRVLVPFMILVPVIAWCMLQIDTVYNFTVGEVEGRFGQGYGAIGWHKWIRNPVDLAAVLLVGLGIPACLFLPRGFKAIAGHDNPRAWLCLASVAVFAVFMGLVSPITYYRHFLPLMPAAALIAALGFCSTQWAQRRWFLVLFFLWPALLALDFELDYHQDPRIEFRRWYRDHTDDRVFVSYYVAPPVRGNRMRILFRPEYAFDGAAVLKQGEYLVLSENWYDTSFANELNGPLVNDLSKLVKTTPEYASLYRDILAARHPNLQPVRSIDIRNLMPELVIHKALYGTFQMFVGDLKIYRIRQ